MPSSRPWSQLCRGLTDEDAALLLQTMKAWKTVKNELMSCTACSSGVPHSMRYKLLRCCCKHWKATTPYVQCPWRMKVLVCQQSGAIDIHELGEHHSIARSPSPLLITPRQRAFIKELARENLMPQRIRHALARTFDLSPAALPPLRTVQNIVHHYRRTRQGGNDKHKQIVEAIRRSAYSGREDEHDAFTFTNDYDEGSLPIVSSEARPFLVGMTTKALLRNAVRDPGTFVLHLDATFKLNSVGYPVLVCGITDASRTFHLVALFITSQLRQSHFAAVLIALRRMYARVNGIEMAVKYVLGDADSAQRNAFYQVFGDDCDFDYLMCFYHVVAKLRERSRSLGSELWKIVFRGVYDLHFSGTDTEYADRKTAMLEDWDAHVDLTAFSAHVQAQGLQGPFTKWQCFQTPSGTRTIVVEWFSQKRVM